MIWQNPWAWLGLAGVAAPILAHLLARRRARRLPFPTLRFLGASRLMLARRDRLTDLALLLVRCGTIAAAAAALAQPWVLTARRGRDLGQAIARAVIVDTSASLRRPTPTGGTGLDAAEREGRRLASEAAIGTVQLTPDPARALAGAAAWLDTEPGRREMAVVSDFQTGTIDARDLAVVPADIGVRLERIPITPATAPIDAVSTADGVETTAHLTLTPVRTDVEWTTHRSGSKTADGQPLLLTGAGERAAADAAADAARAAGPSPGAPDRPVAIVFPGFDGRDALLAAAAPPAEPWMFDAIAAIRRDTALAEVARADIPSDARPAPPPFLALESRQPFTTVAVAADDRPLVLAARARVDGRDRLVFFSRADAGSLASAALLASVAGAISPPVPAAELDPSTVADDVLRTWERAPGTIAPPGARDGPGASDGRWLWGAALVLLGIETWMRRSSRVNRSAEVVHARVA